MAEIAGQTRLTGAAAKFIDARLAAGRAAFPLNDLVEETGLSIIAARNQLLRLVSRVVRVSRWQQFFLIVRPEHRAMGAPRLRGGSTSILAGEGIGITWRFNRRRRTVGVRKPSKSPR